MEQNNEIMNFHHPVFGTVRTMVDEQEEPWFVGVDVAKALGYTDYRHSISDHVDKEDRKLLIISQRGQNDHIGNNSLKTRVNMINESGLYSLILGSKLPSAKKFKRWVTAEVLPEIRKHGGYMMANINDSVDEINRRAQEIAAVTTKRLEDQLQNMEISHANQLQAREERYNNKIVILTKKYAIEHETANYARALILNKECMTTTQIAKELEMSAIELNKILCVCHIQYKQSGQYMLYADYARRGLATNRTYEGHTYLVWTQRGRKFIHHLMGTMTLRAKLVAKRIAK
ncbi:MAG: BRO family protein [Prevotella sp.]|nr:BRO family protein [Prevotella sp.]